MVTRFLGIVIVGLLASCSRPLTPDERRLVGSWQSDLPKGERLIDTLEPDHTRWTVIMRDNGEPLPGPSSRWHIDEKQKLLVYEHIKYPFATESRPSEYGIVMSDVGDQTMRLGGLIFTKCDRPKKPSSPFSPP
jgi:hypothetical protein